MKLNEKKCAVECHVKTIEQWLNVKFLVKLGKSRAKITNKLSSMVYGEDVLKSLVVYKWVKSFQEGCEDVGDDVWIVLGNTDFFRHRS